MLSKLNRKLVRDTALGLIKSLSAGEVQGVTQRRRDAISAYTLATECGDRLLEAEALFEFGQTQSPTINPAYTWSAMRQAEQIFEANGLPSKALLCRIAAAQALYDLGEERNSVALLEDILESPALHPADRCRCLVQVARCYSLLGELDLAFQLLRPAVQIADDVGSFALRVFARWAVAMMHLYSLMQAKFPSLWRGLPDRPAMREAVRSPAEILDIFVELQDVIGPAPGFPYFHVSSQLIFGLAGDLTAAQARLKNLAEAHAVSDPPYSAWALHCLGLLLRHGKDELGALRVVAEAISIAQDCGMDCLIRDCLLMRSRAFEALGDTASALIAYRRFSDLRIKGLMLSSRSDRSAAWAPDQINGSGARFEHVTAPHGLRNLEPAVVRKAAKFIDEAEGKNVAVNDVVLHCGVSRRTLETSFKRSKHSTIADYIKRRRLDHAAAQLLNSDVTIQEIAASVGYQSPGAFAREFRSMFGVLPSDWRQARRLDHAGK